MQIDIEKLESAAEALRAMGHPLRIVIIQMLAEGENNVTDIHQQLDVEQAVASHHLRIMKDKGIVSARRDGKNRYYGLADERYALALNLITKE